MNALGFVLSLLTILSLGALLSLDKQTSAYKLRSSYLGHVRVNREMLNQCISVFYKSLKQPPHPAAPAQQKHTKCQSQEKIPQLAINPSCARINLFPLIERDVQEEIVLYKLTAKFLKMFYKDLFANKPRFEYQFLDALLTAARQQALQNIPLCLEKLDLHNPDLQSLYYQILKGTKKGAGYPSLLEYIKIEPACSKICLRHAHPHVFALLFSSKTAKTLYRSFHSATNAPPNRETIEHICLSAQLLLNPAIFDLIDLSFSHPNATTVTLENTDHETHISLKKTIVL